MSTLLAYFRTGSAALSVVLCGDDRVLHVLLYVQCQLQVDDVADNLKNQNGFVPGVRPGKKTAEYLEFVVTAFWCWARLTSTLVCLLPEIMRGQFAIPFYFGGTSVLIVVSVTMDTIQQVQSHLLAHQYEGLIENPSCAVRAARAQETEPIRR